MDEQSQLQAFINAPAVSFTEQVLQRLSFERLAKHEERKRVSDSPREVVLVGRWRCLLSLTKTDFHCRNVDWSVRQREGSSVVIAAVLRQPQLAIHDIKVNGAQDIVQDVREGSCFLSSERGEIGIQEGQGVRARARGNCPSPLILCPYQDYAGVPYSLTNAGEKSTPRPGPSGTHISARLSFQPPVKMSL